MGKLNEKQLMDMAKDLVKYIQIVKIEIVMQRGCFWWNLKRTVFLNGKHSSEFNVFMRERPERLSAGRVVELRERMGNDSIAVDFAYYKM